MAKYKILGAEGEEVEVNGNKYGGGVGTEVELSDEEASIALSEGKIELVNESEEESEEEEVEEGEEGVE